MSTLAARMSRHTDLVLVALLLGVLTVLFAPIPSGLLDFLILLNFSFALLLLLLTFYMDRPADLSTFPSLLLVATLFRLSLNVAATRLILAKGDAGNVIGAVGGYVVGGNYVIGLIVFLILVVVQYVVITSGAQRVSEVAARFTLDSLPGQQMSIDADLNMGFIDQEEAQRRRRRLEKEASFYGAMDGASKFVKGDAIAGIVIMLINIVGGLVIGVMQGGLKWDQALHTYTLLTVGDGIVTQVPALVIAVGTGIIVTRSASDANLASEVVRQVTSAPKALALVMVALALLTLMPGIPALPVLAIVMLLGGVLMVALRARRRASAAGAGAAAQAPGGASPAGAAIEDPAAVLAVEPVEVHVGSGLAALAIGDASVLAERVRTFRTQFAREMGMVLPAVRFLQSAKLATQAYELSTYGVVCARGEIRPGQVLAIHPSGDTRLIPGTETHEPTYGLPALWIDDAQREAARAHRYTLVDPPTVFITHVSETLRQQCAQLLTRGETDKLLQRVRQAQPGLVEELVPTVLTISDVQKVLQSLLREKVSIRNIEAIIETLVDAGRSAKDAPTLTEHVRQRLGSAICRQLMGEATTLEVLTLDPALEHSLRDATVGGTLAAEPRLAEQFLARTVSHAEQMMKKGLLPVLLCAPELRRHVRALTERAIPHMRVLGITEIPNNVPLRSFGTVAVA
ncbi:MAG: FHIPEP family type III secretion protein [Burkholderiales bacterium]|nr:FHIPEP family type III secretion protein [Burkholderiales bacterium]